MAGGAAGRAHKEQLRGKSTVDTIRNRSNVIDNAIDEAVSGTTEPEPATVKATASPTGNLSIGEQISRFLGRDDKKK